MSDGIAGNKLNDLSKVYLDQISAFREIRKQETEKDIERWTHGADPTATQKEAVDVTAKKPKAPEFNAAKELVQKAPYMKPALQQRNEGFSNWRDDLIEVIDKPETEKEAAKKVTEKNVKNKIEINPKITEAIKEIGGELISVEEQKEDPNSTVVDHGNSPSTNAVKAKEKRQGMLKKQVLLKKLQAVRAGAGADITASYDPLEAAIEYLYEEGINEEGVDLLIEEIGLEGFVEFVDESAVELNEERAARKASVRAPSYEKVKASVDKSDAAKKAAKKKAAAPKRRTPRRTTRRTTRR